ncbi:uncharacterized protein PHACADRAFT_186312 [Phanerochaete carnosa HHB-10118-sp]|uniref:Uncharacterized protein n=1 Tax=Phanerochaete carnosa (strain HHB-10118-sp) TaxID=650164 RepID=K5WTF0_PHACS|nr:uncharacterized protein PHACADRAFT_186312 [Phanerochaete carnosa HHB-10118-sp]EKM53707.1 hypothetical protein PHACADRAFT_186312 [Phanerochaete carnosa HHB-10118-sp]
MSRKDRRDFNISICFRSPSVKTLPVQEALQLMAFAEQREVRMSRRAARCYSDPPRARNSSAPLSDRLWARADGVRRDPQMPPRSKPAQRAAASSKVPQVSRARSYMQSAPSSPVTASARLKAPQSPLPPRGHHLHVPVSRSRRRRSTSALTAGLTRPDFACPETFVSEAHSRHDCDGPQLRSGEQPSCPGHRLGLRSTPSSYAPRHKLPAYAVM